MKKQTVVVAFFVGVIFNCGVFAERYRPHGPRCIGEYSAPLKAIEPTLDHLTAAAAEAKRQGCVRLVRLAALVDKNFKKSDLHKFGWRQITRIGNVITLEGCTGSAPYLAALNGIIYVKNPYALYPCMDSVRVFCRIDDVHENRYKDLPKSFTGRGVLVAVFDTEFDTHHPAFLDSNGQTRFVALWDQRDTTQPQQNRFGYGIIKNHEQLKADTAFGRSGTFHGTLMASYAAGGDRRRSYYAAATEARLLGVQYAGTDNELIDAIVWAFSVADSLNMPCVINMSIGVAIGPHDGTSLLDRVIDSMSGPGRIIVGAVGNDGDKKAHIAFSLNRNEVRGTYATPNVSVDEKGYSIAATAIDFWGDTGRPFSVRWLVLDTVTLQYQQSSQTVTTTANRTYRPQAVLWRNEATGKYDTCFIQISVENQSPLNQRPHAQIFYQTTNPRLFLGVAVSIPVGGRACTVHGWNGAKLAFRSFGHSGFSDGDNDYCVNEVGGTAKRIITVGSYVNKVSYITWEGGELSHPQNGEARNIATWSGRGPTLDGRIKPDICAPGSNVAGAMSFRAVDPGGFTVLWPDYPSLSSRYSMGTGTSVSSPIVAGIIALMLQANPRLTPEQCRNILQETAITDEQTGQIQTPNNIWGAGKVNALAAVKRALELPTFSALRARERVSSSRLVVKIKSGRIAALSGDPLLVTPARVELFDNAGRRIFSGTVDLAEMLRFKQHLYTATYVLRTQAGRESVCRVLLLNR